MLRRPTSTAARSERGFALILTVTLLAFLVLTLVALATVTRVETQVAANGQQLAQARQNALMALNIALGELQKYAGPDQRTTARADLQHGATAANGRWTGVYGSAVRADYTQRPSEIATALTDPALVAVNGSPARLLTWLVSGNESVAFDPATDIGSAGEIARAPATIPVVPGTAVANLTAATTALSDDITIPDTAGTARRGRLLVGPGSVTSSESAGVALDYVAVPAVDIRVAASQVPGAGHRSEPVTIGRYAWWVGDEGMKARINLPLAGSAPGLGADEQLEQKRRAFSNATRAAVELMDRANVSEPAPALNAVRIDTTYDPSAPVERIVSLNQLPMVSPAPGPLTGALKARFHDLTPHSYSVLSDTYAGGLKQDLTRILASSSTGPASTSTLWTAESNSEDTTFIPTWGHLRDFYATTASNGVITPRLPVYGNGIAGAPGVSPVLTYAAVGFRYAAADTPAAGGPINLNLYPLAVLWNPYANTLAGGTYEVGLRIAYQGSHAGVKLSVNKGTDDAPVWVVKEIRDLAQAGAVLSPTLTSIPTNKPIQYFRFKVTCPDLAPGESRVFTLDQNALLYQPGQNNLVPGFDFDRYVSLSNATFAADEVDKDFKFEPMPGSRLKGTTSSSSGGAASETGAYLGDGTAPPNTVAGTWDPAVNKWYQSIQRVDYMGITDAYTAFQDAEPLRAPISMDEPAIKVLFMNTFSAIGRSYTLNSRWGTNISCFRWIAQGNIRAPYLSRTVRDQNYVSPYYARAGIDSSLWPIWFFENPVDPSFASSGMSLDYDIGGVTNAKKTIDATLFEVRESGDALTSIGQLQHAGLSLSGAYPSYPVGNALADFRLRNTAWLAISSGRPLRSDEVAIKQRSYYDVSWLLNRNLWDRYVLSTIPASGSVPAVLENPRLVRNGTPSDSDLRSTASAAHLLLAGGFNINSTSEQAWRAILGAANQLGYDPQSDSLASTATGIAASRFRRPTGGATLPANVRQVVGAVHGDVSTYAYYTGDNLEALWQGYRLLTAEEIAQLARNVVAEIRTRGPFVSLADFINRRIIDSDPYVDTNDPTNGYPVKPTLTPAQKSQFLSAMKGTLQAAIDATIRSTPNTAYAINTMDTGSYWASTRSAALVQNHGMNALYSQPLARGDPNPASADKTPQRTTAAFAPKFLTQADLLSSIGASLSARSDTFTIRSYGEVLDPVNSTDSNPVITGRAWCEAVVQRLPDYVDDTLPPETVLASVPASPTATTNKTFGRKFKVVAFRWLSSSDI